MRNELRAALTLCVPVELHEELTEFMSAGMCYIAL